MKLEAKAKLKRLLAQETTCKVPTRVKEVVQLSKRSVIKRKM